MGWGEAFTTTDTRARPLTEGMLVAAMTRAEEGTPPCGSAERPHVVHPDARGVATCANCFHMVRVV